MVTATSLLGNLWMQSRSPESVLSLSISGNEEGFDDEQKLPTDYEEKMKDIEAQSYKLSLEEAKTLFIHSLTRDSDSRARLAEEITISNVQLSVVYWYILKSQVEKRRSEWRSEPYKDQNIPEKHKHYNIWNIHIKSPLPFTKGIKVHVLEGTQFVQSCNQCAGFGEHPCLKCKYWQAQTCNTCPGSALTNDMSNKIRWFHSHTAVNGHSKNRCTECNGRVIVSCNKCQGHRELYTYLQLKIEWEILFDEKIFGNSSIPEEIIRNCVGQLVFSERKKRVKAISHFSDSDVLQVSEALINGHLSKLTSEERLVQQKQTLKVIPIFEVDCVWSERPEKYFIYDIERRVYYTGERPHQFCVCCLIL